MEEDYIEPWWSSKPQSDYSLEVMKDGAIIEELNISEKAFYVIGR